MGMLEVTARVRRIVMAVLFCFCRWLFTAIVKTRIVIIANVYVVVERRVMATVLLSLFVKDIADVMVVYSCWIQG